MGFLGFSGFACKTMARGVKMICTYCLRDIVDSLTSVIHTVLIGWFMRAHYE